MYLSLKTETFGNENQAWLGSAHGTQATRSGTLVLGAFTAGTHFPNGFIPSGTPIAQFTSGANYDANVATYGPYTAGSVTGLAVLAGFTFTTQAVPAGVTTGNIPAAILDHGRVIVSLLPIAIDATAQATNAHFVYVAHA